MTIKGYPSSEKLDSTSQNFATVQPVSANRHGLDVVANMYTSLVASDAAEASSTAYVINATSHVAKVGMVIAMTSGSAIHESAPVIAVTANTITLGSPLSVAPSAGNTFDILRYVHPTLATSGAISVVTSTQQRSVTYKDRHDYSSTTVTTAAYTELVSSTPSDIYNMLVFDSSGRTILLATGGAGAESDLMYIFPGGLPATFQVYIASGTRLSIKAVGANATSGEFLINCTD